MDIVFGILSPVVLLVALGFALRAGRFLPATFFAQLNRFVFWVALPAVLFRETAQAPLSMGAAARTAGAVLSANLATLLLSWAAGAAMRLPGPTLRSFVQAGFRGNYSYVGLPVVFFAITDEAARSVALLALAMVSLVNNAAAVVVLTAGEEGDVRGGDGRAAKAAAPAGGGIPGAVARGAKRIAANPLVVSSALGVAFSVLHARTGCALPGFLDHTLKGAGDISMGGALIALGASLEPGRLRGVLPLAAAATLFRLAICPLLTVAAAMALGLPGVHRLAALLFSSCPCAVASYVMADQMGADRELAGAAVVLSTLCAVLSLATVLLL